MISFKPNRSELQRSSPRVLRLHQGLVYYLRRQPSERQIRHIRVKGNLSFVAPIGGGVESGLKKEEEGYPAASKASSRSRSYSSPEKLEK